MHKILALKNLLPFLLACVFLSLASCKNLADKRAKKEKSQELQNMPAIIQGMFGAILIPEDTVAIADYISQKLTYTDAKTPLKIYGVALYDFQEVASAYNNQHYNALWIVSPLADSAFAALEEIQNDGLFPEDYGMPQILELRNKLVLAKEKDLSKWAELDILLTNALLHYGQHLLQGKLEPTTLDKFWNFTKREAPEPLGKLLAKAQNENHLNRFFVSVRPQNPLYLNMRKSLQHYKLYASTGGWEKLVWNTKKSKLEPGDTDAIVPYLRVRLAAEGYLETANYASDSVYDGTLQGAMASFQKYHGLYADSVLGKTTISLLNITAQQKVDAILVNLERLRWSIGNLSGSYILVNAAEFRLWFFEDDVLTWQTEVIIGAPYTATPFFTADLQRVVFNPTWTLPYSIASKEMLPKLRKDPGHLAKQNMIMMNREGKIIDPHTVDFNKIATNNFPYIIRQQPSKTNSLGVVKFEMPNSYSIYLHDTPSKSLFKREERAFSHGCIRVNKPLTLAEKVLEKNSNWRADTIPIILESGKTTSVRLEKSIPVLLLYITQYTAANGQAYFFKDVYKADKKLLDALKP